MHTNYVSLGSYRPAERLVPQRHRAYRQRSGTTAGSRLEALLTPNLRTTIAGSQLSLNQWSPVARALSSVTLNQSSNSSSVDSGPVSPVAARKYQHQRAEHRAFNDGHVAGQKHAPAAHAGFGTSLGSSMGGGARSAFVGRRNSNVADVGVLHDGISAEMEDAHGAEQSRVPLRLACELRRAPAASVDFDREFSRAYAEFSRLHDELERRRSAQVFNYTG